MFLTAHIIISNNADTDESYMHTMIVDEVE